MLPEHLIAEFWESVRRLLHTRFHRSERAASDAVERFRQHLDQDHLGELIYHREPGTVAEIVSGWDKEGKEGARGIPA